MKHILDKKENKSSKGNIKTYLEIIIHKDKSMLMRQFQYFFIIISMCKVSQFLTSNICKLKNYKKKGKKNKSKRNRNKGNRKNH